MNKKLLSAPLALMLMLASLLSFSGCLVDTCHDCSPPPPPPCTTCNPTPCAWGPNGVAGPAYFGLSYACCAPTYVWTNNTAIPPTFRYGDYYNSLPGSYRLYYEGRQLVGCCYTEYYWDVTFTVWVNPGTNGGCGYAGTNGLPSYLMIACGPDGPGELRTNKLAEQDITVTVISENAQEVIVQYSKGDIHVRVTYHRLSESIKRQLDPSGVVKGS